MNYERHELSALFQDMSDESYNELKSDVKRNGFTDPEIFLYDGKILDGWHRYSVACELQKTNELDFVKLSQEFDAKTYVVSKNLHRRHYTPSQRAQIVVEANEWGQHGGDRSKSPNGDLKSRTDLAKEAGVGTTTIDRAKDVSKAGRADEVISGKKSASAVLKDEADKNKVPPPGKPPGQQSLPIPEPEDDFTGHDVVTNPTIEVVSSEPVDDEPEPKPKKELKPLTVDEIISEQVESYVSSCFPQSEVRNLLISIPLQRWDGLIYNISEFVLHPDKANLLLKGRNLSEDEIQDISDFCNFIKELIPQMKYQRERAELSSKATYKEKND